MLSPRLSESSGAAAAALCRPVQVLPAKRGILRKKNMHAKDSWFLFLPRCCGVVLKIPSENYDVNAKTGTLVTLPPRAGESAFSEERLESLYVDLLLLEEDFS